MSTPLPDMQFKMSFPYDIALILQVFVWLTAKCKVLLLQHKHEQVLREQEECGK